MQTGFLILSDITGYTAFLTESELEHANAILNSLFEILLENHKPPLRVAKLEGDAVFAYITDGALGSSQAILDTVQSLYISFRVTQERMRLNTTCTCNACRNIPNLDLKFFIHHGSYIIQTLGGSTELTSPDVILVHRLLKNTVVEQTSLHAYALFTQAACQKISNPEFDAGLLEHHENYEHLGGVNCRLLDLHELWAKKRDLNQPRVTASEADLSFHFRLDASPQTVWDLITNPQTRMRILGALAMNVSERQNGRIGPGSTFHCDHGKDVTTQQIVSWQPFALITTDDTFEIPFAGACVLSNSWFLKAEANYTDLTINFALLRAKNPSRQKMAGIFWKLTGHRMINQAMLSGISTLNELIHNLS